MNFMTKPESKYHNVTMPGPAQPTNYDNFLENNIMSRVGFVKFEYMVDKEFAHFYISEVNL